MNNEEKLEKSKEQAEIIQSIAIQIICLDTDFLKKSAQELRETASHQYAMSTMNRNFSSAKNSLLILKCEAIENLCKYVDSLKKIDACKIEIKNEEPTQKNYELKANDMII